MVFYIGITREKVLKRDFDHDILKRSGILASKVRPYFEEKLAQLLVLPQPELVKKEKHHNRA